MRTVSGVNIALALGATGAVAGGTALARLRDENDLDETPVAVPTSPPLHPTQLPEAPARPMEPGAGTVDGIVDQFVGHYDHSRDGVIEIGRGEQFGTDERITGDIGNIHTMVGFFREADFDGDLRVTRDELHDAISWFDTQGTYGFDPRSPEGGDGILGIDELQVFAGHAYGSFSDAGAGRPEFGVPQTYTVDGEMRNNEGFFQQLPEYRAWDGTFSHRHR